MVRIASILLVLIFILGATNCSGVRIRPDSTSVLAAEAGDKTVLIEGCGNQPIVGYTYCRVREGSPTNQELTLIAPDIKCKTEPCVVFTIFYPDGSPTKSIALPGGQTKVSIKWSDLVKRDTFQKGDRGFWPILMDYKWLDLAGNEFQSTIEGEIRMRVLSAQYVPLHESSDDSNFAWKWKNNGYEFAMTTAGRTYTGKAVK